MARTPAILTVLLTCLVLSAAAAAFAPRAPAARPAADDAPAALEAQLEADDASRRLVVAVRHSGQPADAFLAVEGADGSVLAYRLVHVVPGDNTVVDTTLDDGAYRIRFTIGVDALVLTVGASAETSATLGECEGTLSQDFTSSYTGLGLGAGTGEQTCLPREA